MTRRMLLTIGILIIPLDLLASSGNCEKILTPPWIEREVSKFIDGIPKSESVKNTFAAKINQKDLILQYSKYSAKVTPSKGTILFLCGGPGAPCDFGGRPYAMPDGYDILVMDYLGVGENKKVNQPEMMSIDSQASAASQLVSYLKPKNLVIYGHSFGTAVATAAASKLTSAPSNSEKSLVKGVFLEGVVGKGDFTGYSNSFANAANTAWSLLNNHEKQKFKNFYMATAKKLTPDELGAFNAKITSNLADGSIPASQYLKSVCNSSVEDLKKSLEMSSTWRKALSTGDSLNQIRAAGCQIFGASQDQEEQKIFDNTVTLTTPMPKGTCDCKTLSKVWNPIEYQIRGVPVIYINGKQDPNTSYEWAKTHFDGQSQSSDKVLISTMYGGHHEMGMAPLKTCADEFFASLVAQDISSIKSNQDAILKGGCSSPKGVDKSGTSNSGSR